MNKPRAKLFQGTSDDLDGLHDQIAQWLDTTNATPLNFSFNTRYHEQDDKWAILGIILYVQGTVAQPTSSIAVPTLRFSSN